ncbi:MAG TPA: ATPase, partial [Actinomycetota bacterium]|nr:ATPase [Actinomycetota bacterium]
LEGLLGRTLDLVDKHRLQILAVAHALETHKTVTGEDVEAIIEGRAGPLIDGRPYHSDAFEELAERYHSQVVEAHKTHERVKVALPELDRAEWSSEAR